MSNISKIRGSGYIILFCSLILGGVGYLITHNINSIDFLEEFTQDFYANISTELFSLALTILILDKLYEGRANEEEKRRLILQMGSPDNTFAIEAVRQLKVKGWLFDGSLCNANLQEANLMGADLTYADLSGSNLSKANFRSASLAYINLSSCELISADFQNTYINIANFTNANLSSANFENAVIFDVAFNNAEMYFCNLKGVTGFVNNLDKLSKEPLFVAKSLTGTTLPNGKKYTGKYNLTGDIEYAKSHRINTNNQSAMKNFYKNPPDLLHVHLTEYRSNWIDHYKDNKA